MVARTEQSRDLGQTRLRCGVSLPSGGPHEATIKSDSPWVIGIGRFLQMYVVMAHRVGGSHDVLLASSTERAEHGPMGRTICVIGNMSG